MASCALRLVMWDGFRIPRGGRKHLDSETNRPADLAAPAGSHLVDCLPAAFSSTGPFISFCKAENINEPTFLQRLSGLTRRGLFPVRKTPNTPQTVIPAPAQNNSRVVTNSACVQPPINNVTWIKLGLDNYLSNLPGGTNMTLHQYAAAVGASNFICGIGEKCQAGQLCDPVQSPAWEVLVGAQEWNNFQNKLYDAVGVATQIVTSISSSLVVDLYPPEHSGHLWDVMKSVILATGVASSFALLAEIGIAITSAAIFTTLISTIGIAGLAVTAGIAGGIGTKLALKKPEPDSFDRWSVYAFYLSEWQQHAQKSIANSTRSVIASGVSTPQGISAGLKNGTFFYERPRVNEAQLTSGLKNTTTVRILTDILRNQNGFVTIASDKCTGKGPGGAWKGDDKLSYCSPNGTMFNIIHGSKKKVNNKWHNAELIIKKYGISVQYLAEQSYYCQLNHGSANFDPYKSGAFPHDLNSECIANLPVCDFRDPELAEMKKEKGTMSTCRVKANLPI
ncbi:hypothetical protein O181_013276 [Austropuccinia psidii MF-1]|uniref:DUF7872 domain-containing protein n=1 Tax=Austropuccinia psidii MF-1 TaxID=1389203 RepID=A0A9Q3GN24_9BASI|nr:hypothetical protein [Austropuccinia psidii MF-1]